MNNIIGRDPSRSRMLISITMSRFEVAVALLVLAFCHICITLSIDERKQNEQGTSYDKINKNELNLSDSNITSSNKETIDLVSINVTQSTLEVNDPSRLNVTVLEINDTNHVNLTQISTTEISITGEDSRSGSNVTEESVKDSSGGKNETVPWWRRRPYPLRQRARPCQCIDFKCGCCAGMEIQRLNISQKGCLNFEYDPDEFSIEMEMLMNNRALVRRSVSAKNPPPLCIPIPSLVSFVPRVEFCTRLFNIFTPGRNFHACLDWQTKINSSPVLEFQFDCMRIGADGFALVKPDAGGGLPDIGAGGVDYGVSEGSESEDYDPLDPEYPEVGNKRPNKKKPSTTVAP